MKRWESACDAIPRPSNRLPGWLFRLIHQRARGPVSLPLEQFPRAGDIAQPYRTAGEFILNEVLDHGLRFRPLDLVEIGHTISGVRHLQPAAWRHSRMHRFAILQGRQSPYRLSGLAFGQAQFVEAL